MPQAGKSATRLASRSSTAFARRPVVSVALILACMALCASPGNGSNQQDPENSPHRSKAFNGKLPITELTEDEGVLYALGPLGYGPRLGDLDQVKQMGLEKWITNRSIPLRSTIPPSPPASGNSRR
jgi:hypothetical protein